MFYLNLARIIIILTAAVVIFSLITKMSKTPIKGTRLILTGFLLICFDLSIGAIFHSGIISETWLMRWYLILGTVSGFLGQTTGLLLLMLGCYLLVKSLIPQVNAHYSSLVENSLVGVYLIQGGKFVFVNPRLAEIFGYSREELIGKEVIEVVAPESREKVRENIRRRLEGEIDSLHYKFNAQKKDGTQIFVEVYGNRTEYDRTPAIHGTLIDITERLQTHLLLKESEERYRKLVETLPDGIAVHQDGYVLYVNPAALKFLGYENADEVIGRPILDFIHPDYHNMVKRRVQNLAELAERVPIVEEKFLRSDGTAFDVEVGGFPIQYGNQTAMMAVFTDITERKKTERALLDSEAKYRSLFEESQDVIYISSGDGRLLDINPAGVKMFGYQTKEELLSIDIAETLYVNPHDRQRTLELLNKYDKIKDFELELRRKDGKRITVMETSTVIRDEKGEIAGYRGILRDVTERKKLEQQLFQAQKMESIGTLAGGIAHDFNNILGGILGYASFIKMKMQKSEPYYKYINVIERSAERAAELTSQLLAFSRGGNYKLEPVDLNEVVEETLAIVESTFDKSIEIRKELSADLPPVEADATQLQQAVMNLCVNARDAMPAGGLLTVKTDLKHLDSNYFSFQAAGAEGNFLELTIADNGCGMDSETLEKIYEPFFTTKEKGKGTGLGMSMVYGVIKSHGGFISADSAPGEGTIFHVFLPVSKKKYQQRLSKEIIPTSGHEVILVVEDEEPLRTMISEALDSFGYEVLLAADGLEGLEKFKANRQRVDLVFLDMVMPRMGGFELFQKLKALDPAVRVLLTTGYSDSQKAQEVLSAGALGLINKPYQIPELLAKLREIFDGEKQTV